MDAQQTSQEPTTSEVPGEKRVRIRGHYVTVPWILSHTKRNHELCNGTGVIRLAGMPKDDGKICGCAMNRATRRVIEMEAEKAATPLDLPPAEPETDPAEERAKRRIERLGAQLLTLESELGQRQAAFDAETASLDEGAKIQAAMVQDLSSEIVRRASYRQQAETAVADAERKLTESKEALKREESALERAKASRVEAEKSFEALRAEKGQRMGEFERRTSRLRGEIKKLQRRITEARVYNGLASTQEEP